MRPRGAIVRSSDIPALLIRKRAQLDEINESRIKTLENMMHEQETKYHNLSNAYSTLKGDFVFNLQLIEDRDAELERYDRAVLELKAVIESKDAQRAELAQELAQMRAFTDRETAKVHQKTAEVEGEIGLLQQRLVQQDTQLALQQQQELPERPNKCNFS